MQLRLPWQTLRTTRQTHTLPFHTAFGVKTTVERLESTRGGHRVDNHAAATFMRVYLHLQFAAVG